MKYHAVKNLVLDGIVDFKWIPTNENVADIFTKPLPAEQFLYLRGKLLNLEPEDLEEKEETEEK